MLNMVINAGINIQWLWHKHPMDMPREGNGYAEDSQRHNHCYAIQWLCRHK
jgi:hypothetical protein